MANVEHSVLTGTDLHESKGVAAATANKVFLTNGAGSGSFTTVPAVAIDAAGTKVFQGQKYHIRDEVSSSSSSQGSLTDSVWNTRRIQTEKTDDLTITLSGNQFTLPAGTYWLDCIAPVYVQLNLGAFSFCEGAAQLRLRNITDSSTQVIGPSMYLTADGGGGTFDKRHVNLLMRQQFTIAGSKVFEVQNWVQDLQGTATTTFSAGRPASTGENEVYLDCVLWKLS